MSSDELSKPLGNNPPRPRLPELSAMVISKNLWYEIEKLKTASAWQLPAGRSSETIANYPDFKIVLLLMKAGTHMPKHHADGRISVYVIQGRIRMNLLEVESTEMGAGDLLTLDRGIEHEIESFEESAFLLTIASA